MAKFDSLIKTVYNNKNGAPKDTETVDTSVGAWDMEAIVGRINEMAEFMKSLYDLSKANPDKLYGLKDGIWTEISNALKKYVIRVGLVDSAYSFIDFPATFDIKTLDFYAKFNPSNFDAQMWLIDVGIYNDPDVGNAYLRIDSGTGKVKVQLTEPNAQGLKAFVSTTALVSGAMNEVELTGGVLTINGIDQGIDISTWVSIPSSTTNKQKAVTIFTNDGNNSLPLKGDIEACRYQGDSMTVTGLGAVLGSTQVYDFNATFVEI